MTTPVTKIVIVSGQEFSVPADTDNEAIRTQLTGMGFADVASATIQTGKKTVEGVEYQTIEFVKKAGTKGLDGVELAALLARVPATAAPALRGLDRDQADLIRRLLAGQLTVGGVLADDGDALLTALRACVETASPHYSEGERQCATLDGLGAVAAAAPCGW